MKTSQVGKFIVGKTDGRFKMHHYYAHYVEVMEKNDFFRMWQVDDWARTIWGYPYWISEKNKLVESSWNRHSIWAVEYKTRGNKRRVYLKGDEELLQFIMRWSAE